MDKAGIIGITVCGVLLGGMWITCMLARARKSYVERVKTVET